MIQAPRGFAKTTLVENFILWHLFVSDLARRRKHEPKFVVIGSKSLRPHATNVLATIKEVLEDSEGIKELFGDYGPKTARKWGVDEVMLADGSVILARGASQPIRGLKRGNVRPTLVAWDDPEDENNTKTQEAMDHNLSVLLKAVIPGMDRIRADKAVVIGTPISEGCMVRTLDKFSKRNPKPVEDEEGKIVAHSGWVSMHYRGIEYKDDLENGKSIWPEMVPLELMLAEKADLEEQGRASYWWSETMCEIVPDTDRVFSRYGYYTGRVELHGGRHYLVINSQGEQTDSDEWRLKSLKPSQKVIPVSYFVGVDPASSVKRHADRSVIMGVAIDENDCRYVVEYEAVREKPLQVADRVEQIVKGKRPDRTRVEDVAYQEMLRQELMNRGLAGIIGVKPPSNQRKEMRLEGMQQHFGSGRMWLQPGMDLLEQEMRSFPQGRHDDTLDALYYAMYKSWRPMHGMEEYMGKPVLAPRMYDERETTWMSS